MFEPDQQDRTQLAGTRLRPDQPYEPVTDVIKTSRMVWGEHCIECAAPDCYTTCDLYKARPDGRCRRLQYGQLPNPNFPSWRGCGVEVRFKQWAKLEARGNLSMESPTAVRAWERALHLSSGIINGVGGVIAKVGGDARWAHAVHSICERWTRSLHRKKGYEGQPDGFLLEIYNPNTETARLQLVIGAVAPPLQPGQCPVPVERFVETFELPSTYSRHFIDRERFQHVIDQRSDFDVSLIPEADGTDHLVIVSADFVKLASLNQPVQGKPGVKCLVWDLDNTLWNGVLLEVQDVQLRPGVLEVLKTLDERGIVHSIASKNTHEHAWSKLDELGVAEYFIRPHINWMPKSQNIGQIAGEINIGIDTLAFVDDNPFELDEVRQAHPDVIGIHVDDLAKIPHMPRFAGSSSSDAKNRRTYYQDAEKREAAQQELGQDYFAFLKQSEIRLTIVPYDASRLERVAELVQRTNQLNHSGQKYRREELLEIIADDELQEYVLICEDRYGSYGTVGFGIVQFDGRELLVRDFMLSCRVQGKFIEQAFFAHLVNSHSGERIERIWVNYRPTDRNGPAWNVLSSMGFESLGDAKGAALDLAAQTEPLSCDFITVLTHEDR